MPRTVTVIPATINSITRRPDTAVSKRRVAAYARVSTDSDEQFTSYEAQIEYYTGYINNHADWELVEVYPDEGISGLSTKRRESFQRMMTDALDGKIEILSAVWIQSHDSSGNEPPFEYPLKPPVQLYGWQYQDFICLVLLLFLKLEEMFIKL